MYYLLKGKICWKNKIIILYNNKETETISGEVRELKLHENNILLRHLKSGFMQEVRGAPCHKGRKK